jgi:hypothetical protein
MQREGNSGSPEDPLLVSEAEKWIGLGKRCRLAWQAATAVLQLLAAFGLPFQAGAQK